MSETIGYLVLMYWDSPMFLTDKGVLYIVSRRHKADLFSSKDAAKAAISASLKYGRKHKFGWKRKDYRIMAVRSGDGR